MCPTLCANPHTQKLLTPGCCVDDNAIWANIVLLAKHDEEVNHARLLTGVGVAELPPVSMKLGPLSM